MERIIQIKLSGEWMDLFYGNIFKNDDTIACVDFNNLEGIRLKPLKEKTDLKERVKNVINDDELWNLIIGIGIERGRQQIISEIAEKYNLKHKPVEEQL